MSLPIAEHEAGHVVMALALGIEVESVHASLLRETRCAKAFSDAIRRPDVSPYDARRGALFCLGGKLHEDLLMRLHEHGPPIPPPRPPHSLQAGPDDLPDDIWEAYRFADVLAGRDAARATIARLMARGLEIMTRNRQAAWAIAQALRESGTLSGEAVRAIWLAHGGCLEPEAVP